FSLFLLVSPRLCEFSFSTAPRPPSSTLFPYTTLFRSLDRGPGLGDRQGDGSRRHRADRVRIGHLHHFHPDALFLEPTLLPGDPKDRKSTRLNSSHVKISYAVFCLKKKNRQLPTQTKRI